MALISPRHMSIPHSTVPQCDEIYLPYKCDSLYDTSISGQMIRWHVVTTVTHINSTNSEYFIADDGTLSKKNTIIIIYLSSELEITPSKMACKSQGSVHTRWLTEVWESGGLSQETLQDINGRPGAGSQPYLIDVQILYLKHAACTPISSTTR